MNFSNKVIVILGPTAVGKTKFASRLAYNFNGEIISADSRQVYIGMDIGTGKDYEDYLVDNYKISTHLIDVVKPDHEFNLYQFTQHFYNSLNEIIRKKRLPFLVGGTGLYLSSIIQQYKLKPINFNSDRAKELGTFSKKELRERLINLNPLLHNTTDLKEKDRLIKALMIAENNEIQANQNKELNCVVIGIYEEREILKEKIRTRLKQRLEGGMIEEVENLLDSGITHEKLEFFGLEYKYMSLYLKGKLNYNDLYQKLASSIIKFSKRQMTWFRKMEKEGVKINWLKISDINSAKKIIKSFVDEK